MPIQLTTRCLRVEGVLGDVRRQINLVRDIDLPCPARHIESVDTKVKNVEHKILPNKVLVEFTLHRQVYYVDCCSEAVMEFTLPDERIREFININGARPCDEQTAKVKVDIEYSETEPIDQHKERHHHHHGRRREDDRRDEDCRDNDCRDEDCRDYDCRDEDCRDEDCRDGGYGHDHDHDHDHHEHDHCHEKFQQALIIKVHAKLMETMEIPFITGIQGENIFPYFDIICIDNVVASGREQYNLSDSYIRLPDDTKKVKFVDAEIKDVEKKVIPNKVIIRGKLHKQIYFVEECSGEVKETPADVPFSVFIHLDGACEDSNVTTDIDIEYLDSEMVVRGGQKFVKETAILQVSAKLIEPVNLSVLTGVDGALVETQTIIIENNVGFGCRQVNIMADITTPLPARKVSWIETHLRDLESEIIPNKVIVKGVLEKHIYYVSDCDDRLRALAVREPFTEFIHIDGATDDDTVDLWGRVEFCDVEPKESKPACHWRQTAIVEICAQVTQSQELTFVTAVQEIEAQPEPEPEPEVEAEQEDCPPGTTFDYTVAQGDTMYRIARAHNVSTNAVVRANPGVNPNNLRVGQVIQVPCPGGMG